MRGIVLAAVVSIVCAMPAGGFVVGFTHCRDCGWNVLARSIAGLLFAFLTVVSGGYPPLDAAGVREVNAWPHILWSGIVIFVLGSLAIPSGCMSYRPFAALSRTVGKRVSSQSSQTEDS